MADRGFEIDAYWSEVKYTYLHIYVVKSNYQKMN